MIALLLRSRMWASIVGKFKIGEYSREDYTTMCGLLKEKYFLNNEEIQTSGLIKLLDDTGKVIGVYTASEARKKALALGLDMVLVSQNTFPIVCKAADFRHRTITRFYNQIVQKKQKEISIKASTIKSLRVSASLNQNELALKSKQVAELALKNMKVRVSMQVSESNRNDCLSKLDWLKSELLNKCYIEDQYSTNRRYDQDDEDQEENDPKAKKRSDIYSFVVKARESNFVSKANETKSLDPETSIKTFLRKYYQQNQGEMMDLKSEGKFEIDSGVVSIIPEETQIIRGRRRLQPTQNQLQVMRQAEARVLNKRLKQLLSYYN